MAERKVIPFLVPTYQQRSLKLVGQQKLKNLYFHVIPGMIDGRGKLSEISYGVLSTPGLSSVVTTTGTLVRACISYNNVGYAVVDDKIKKITSAFVVSDLGVTLGGSTGTVTIAAVGTEVVVCANSKIYRIVTITDVVTDITSSLTSINALNIPIWVMAQNSRFIYMTSNSNYIYISDLYAAATITALNAYRPNTISGTLSAGAVTTWYQYYFNENSVEVFKDTGAEIGPFSRVEGGAISIGIAANTSAVSILNKVYFLGRTASGLLGVVELDGTNYKVVSTPDFVQRVDDYVSYSDAIGWTDTHNGHLFYNITFPNVTLASGYEYNIGTTWSYDITTNMWFERTSYDEAADGETRHIANCSMFLGGKQLVGSYVDGDFYEISADHLDESGTYIRREIITSTLIDRDSFFSIYNLEIDIERGIGLVSGQGSDPQISLETSTDRGNTWSQPMIRSAGATGQYSTVVRFSSIGGGRSMTLRLRMTDPVPWAFAGITGEVEGSID
jgi:hypothetical protein